MKKKTLVLAVAIMLIFQSGIMAFAADDNIIVDGICYSSDMKTIVSWTEIFEGNTFTVPDGVTEIGERAFSYGCPIKEIVLADSVEKIGKEAFYRSGIESVTVTRNSRLAEIGENAFSACYALSVIFLPQNTVKIDDTAFTGCTSLTIINVWQDNIWQDSYKDTLKLEPGNIRANGDLTAADARIILRISAKLEAGDAYSILLGDVNRDGKITAADARLVLRRSAHLL